MTKNRPGGGNEKTLTFPPKIYALEEEEAPPSSTELCQQIISHSLYQTQFPSWGEKKKRAVYVVAPFSSLHHFSSRVNSVFFSFQLFVPRHEVLISFLSLFLHSLFPLLLAAGQGSPEGTLIHGLFSSLLFCVGKCGGGDCFESSSGNSRDASSDNPMNWGNLMNRKLFHSLPWMLHITRQYKYKGNIMKASHPKFFAHFSTVHPVIFKGLYTCIGPNNASAQKWDLWWRKRKSRRHCFPFPFLPPSATIVAAAFFCLRLFSLSSSALA